MDPFRSLRDITTKLLDSIHFYKLDHLWICEVIENEFTDAGVSATAVRDLFANNAVSTLDQLTNVFIKWSKTDLEIDASESESSNEFSAEETLWTVLDEIDISGKQILALIYLLCTKTTKRDTPEDKELVLASARLYFNFLRVPVSGVKDIFHPNLFKLCIDCLPAADFITDTAALSPNALRQLCSIYVLTLKSLIFLLKDFYLGNSCSPIEYTIAKLTELCAYEVQNAIPFDTGMVYLEERELVRRYEPAFIISTLAYQSLVALLDSNANGEKDQNYKLILSNLIKHILCQKAYKSKTITRRIHVVKNNAIAFICHNLLTRDSCSKVTLDALKHLCLEVRDKAEFRSAVSVAVINILAEMKTKHVAEMIRWILLLIDAEDAKARVFAVEVLGCLLKRNFQRDYADFSDNLKPYLTRIPITFAILTRCDDISPAVRAKALSVASQNMKDILQLLEEAENQNTIQTEVPEEIDELDVNGSHRFFWYNMTSSKKRVEEITAILKRRFEDSNVNARKAAVVAMGTLMTIDCSYSTVENLSIFNAVTKDDSTVVRKQMMDSMSLLLENYRDSSDIQACWLKCILPLTEDPDDKVQTNAVSVLEQQFLRAIFSSSQDDRECAFTLLKLLSSGHFMSYQRYLQKAFSIWKSEKKLKTHCVISLEKYMDTKWRESVLFYLSNFVQYCSVPKNISHLSLEIFGKCQKNKTFPVHMNYILKILSHILKDLSLDELSFVKNVTRNGMKSFNVPVEYIPMYIKILLKTHRHLETELEFSETVSELFKKCEMYLFNMKLENCFNKSHCEELLIKCFCTIKELSQLDSSKISESVISHLKIFAACDISPPTLKNILSPRVQAHAIAALGKICLQHEVLAKALLEVFAIQLLNSQHAVVRNNLIMVLIDMCRLYTSSADKYIPLISLCLKDKVYLIRYQTIVLLVNLLQQGYIRWRGPLFFCLLSTLNDEEDEIQELGRYSMSQLLLEKKTAFSEHFAGSIFVFNNFAPTDNAVLAHIVNQLDRFSLKGEGKREQRMALYKFLLKSTDVKEKEQLVWSICIILTNIGETVYPLNETTECVARDCFAILTCKEIRVLNVEHVSDDIEPSKTEKEMKRNIIDHVEPVIESLKKFVLSTGLKLIRDINLFEKELLHNN